MHVYAVTTAVAAFFAGLALSAVLFGRGADGGRIPVLQDALYRIDNPFVPWRIVELIV